MKTISELFPVAGTEFFTAIERGQQPVRPQHREVPAIFKSTSARFKLVVWFKDGNRRYFFSFDNKHIKKGVHVDEYEGLVKLLRLAKKYAGTFKNFIIYANLDDNKQTTGNYNCQIYRVDMYGHEKKNKAVSFQTKENDIILDLVRMHNLAPLIL